MDKLKLIICLPYSICKTRMCFFVCLLSQLLTCTPLEGVYITCVVIMLVTLDYLLYTYNLTPLIKPILSSVVQI